MSESRSLLRDGHLSLTSPFLADMYGSSLSQQIPYRQDDDDHIQTFVRLNRRRQARLMASVVQGDILELWPGVPTLALTTD
ncbi:hypothetical protein PGT21_001657 [Puccinia graminis f. sp. tritici]|uniref:Uncharacterized protein n=1 Tax=Puccinia graminis f. sp. tritici TaxID=56615 RepID=A0A5B0MBY6_PUCGR|nr:hypothetical protein PGT21_001657 [Puccinia graminis f. sp. tritici]